MKKKLSICLMALTAALVCTYTQAQTQAPVSEKDNFYLAVNQKILAEHNIKPTEAEWNHFSEITDNNRSLLTKDLKKIVSAQGTYAKGTPEQKIADLYQCIMDKSTRDRTAKAELEQVLAPIKAAKSTEDLITASNTLYTKYGISELLEFAPVRRPESMTYSVAVTAISSLLPRDQLLQEPNPGAWEAYKKYIADILVQTGQTEAEANKNAAAIFAWEQKMAPYELTGTEQSDFTVLRRSIPMTDLKKMTKNLQGPAQFAVWDIANEKNVIVPGTKYLQQLDKEFTNKNFPLFKNYLLFQITAELAPLASTELANLTIDYNNKRLGIQQRRPDEEQTVDYMMSLLPYECGQIYVKKYCTAETIADVKNLVNTLRAIHRDRLVHNTWLSDKTKQQAIGKLDSLRVFVGGPAPDDKPLIETMPVVTPAAEGGTFLNNMLKNKKLVQDQIHKLIGTQFNPNKWNSESTYEVNATYSPEQNAIYIPAGILHSPFYDAKADYGTKLGGIGLIIGHELTHAFDNNGSRFDKNGLMKNWWEPKDYAIFKSKAEKFYPYYEAYTYSKNRHMIGPLVVSEAIADCGGLSVVTQAANGNKQFLHNLYRNYALSFGVKMTEEAMAYLLQNDPHPVEAGRVNRALSTTPGFYETYNIKPGDGMYVAPDKRVAIW